MVAGLAVIAALANAVASVLQRLGVEGAPTERGRAQGLVGHMVRQRVWLAGFVVMAGGFVAQAVALHLGDLSVVQPILVSELVLIVVILWAWFGEPVGWRDVGGAVTATAGLVAFLAVAVPGGGQRTPAPAAWWGLAAATALLGGAALAVARRRVGTPRAVALGTAASLGFALTAAFTKAATGELVRGVGALVTTWPLYALAVVGLGSFLLMQHAFQSGSFAAAQGVLILLNPMASVGMGVALFGDRLRGGAPAVIGEVLSLTVMVVGAVVLAGSPLVAAVHDESGDHHALRGKRRRVWRRAGTGA